MAVDDQDVVLGVLRRGDLRAADLAVEASLGGVVLEQVGEVVGGDEVVDGDDVELLAEQALVADRPKHQAADAAETVDADFDHNVPLPEVETSVRNRQLSRRFGTFRIKINGVCVAQ